MIGIGSDSGKARSPALGLLDRVSFPDDARGRLARWLFWPQHRSAPPSPSDLAAVRPPWPGLVAFELGRTALLQGDARAESHLLNAADEPLVRLLASTLGVLATQRFNLQAAAGHAYERQPPSPLADELADELERLKDAVPAAWLDELIGHFLYSMDRPIPPGLDHLWSGGTWELVGTEAPFCGPTVPDAVLLREFEAAQELDDVDLLFCLPDSGSAWVKVRGRPAASVLPQAVRVLIAAATGSDPVRTALGAGASQSTWAKLVSRTRRDLQRPGVPLTFEGGAPVLSGSTIGLICQASKPPEVRLRRGDGPLPFLKLLR